MARRFTHNVTVYTSAITLYRELSSEDNASITIECLPYPFQLSEYRGYHQLLYTFGGWWLDELQQQAQLLYKNTTNTTATKLLTMGEGVVRKKRPPTLRKTTLDYILDGKIPPKKKGDPSRHVPRKKGGKSKGKGKGRERDRDH